MRLTNEGHQQFDRFVATFQPERTDDLRRPETVGTTCEWEVLWMQEPGDPYEGIWVAAPTDSAAVRFHGWAPVTDLVRPAHTVEETP